MVGAIPGARLAVVDDAGHSIAVDQPAGFLAAVAPFLLGDGDAA
jgi:pimeloyl-ACP methyl ester carboxylesterase